MFNKLIVTIITFLAVAHLCVAQSVMPKTVITSVNGKPMVPAVLHTNSNDSLSISFDLLEPDLRYVIASLPPLTLDNKPSQMA
ncbi:MAG: hypothetical protein K2K88_04375, partial [Muribaculaceae bacterium]|nr:hypothetical protein [Muribaculaceae bacterium]